MQKVFGVLFLNLGDFLRFLDPQKAALTDSEAVEVWLMKRELLTYIELLGLPLNS